MGGSSWADDPWVGERYAEFALQPDHWSTGYRSPRERTVSYVVLVDGRVVDTWDEPLTESPWLGDPRVDKVERLWRREPPPTREVAPWRATVDWLEHLVGGPEALDQLTAEPLPDEELALPADAVRDGDLAARFRRTGDVLDVLAGAYFDPELRTAFRRALAAVGMELLGGQVPEDPVQVAAGVCWAVGRANGALAPAGRVTQKALCAQLGLATFPAAKGRNVARLLGTPQPPWVSRPRTLPDLEPLSRTDLLTSRTRRETIALRDATIAAEARATTRGQAQMPEELIDEADVP
ncbi:hypothetical protein [Intrasporangium sp.]|uniref:hypothetical protein n=1 Tax=Intrasporangium sp. TaxID=1925024 RepID=UPI003365ADF0